MHLFTKELRGVGLFLKSHRNELVIVGSAVLFLTLKEYHSIGNDWLSSLLYFAILPIVVILLLRKNPLDFGFRLGNPRLWGFYVIVTCLIAAPILYLTSRIPEFQAYYLVENFSLIDYTLVTLATLFASEFLFRGFLLFGLKEKLGAVSILVQMVPFVMVHFQKPELETLSTIITGIYFGYICYRGNSYWPAFIIHIFINVFFLAAVNLF